MKKLLQLFGIFVLTVLLFQPQRVLAEIPSVNSPTTCSGQVVSIGVEKKLLPLSPSYGRPGNCIKPKYIVLHTTADDKNWKTAEDVYQFFANGSSGAGVSSHFVIGKDGSVLQLLETLSDSVEKGATVLNYNDEQVSIEMAHSGTYASKADMPQAQYDAAKQLVEKLMTQYNIPRGLNDFDWQSETDEHVNDIPPGVYGHYQLNPKSRTDPGIGWLRDFRADLFLDSGTSSTTPPGSSTTSSSACTVVKVGSPAVSPVLPAACNIPALSDPNAALCPIPQGKITCGPSKPVKTSYSNCNEGHCSGDYLTGNDPQCGYPGTFYGIDVPGAGSEKVYIPLLTIPETGEVHALTCQFVGPVVNTQQINQFSCRDDNNGQKVWLQFHHLTIGVQPDAGGTYHSGEAVGGQIDPTQDFKHVHVQIGINGGCGADSSGCVGADKYVQCK